MHSVFKHQLPNQIFVLTLRVIQTNGWVVQAHQGRHAGQLDAFVQSIWEGILCTVGSTFTGAFQDDRICCVRKDFHNNRLGAGAITTPRSPGGVFCASEKKKHFRRSALSLGHFGIVFCWSGTLNQFRHLRLKVRKWAMIRHMDTVVWLFRPGILVNEKSERAPDREGGKQKLELKNESCPGPKSQSSCRCRHRRKYSAKESTPVHQY